MLANPETRTVEQHLVIIPGWMQTSEHWKHTPLHFPNWNIHVIDLPGFGIERLQSSEWGIPEYAAFVRDALVRLEIPNDAYIAALGHSFGGRVLTYLLGSEHLEPLPRTINTLVLYAAPCLYRPSLSVRLRVKAARIAKKIGIASLLPDSLKPYDLRQATDAGLGAIFKRSVPFNLEHELAHITVPTHVLWGERDASVPVRIAEEMTRLLPHATLTVLPGEGHLMHIENPRLFFGTLRRLLA